MIDGLYYVDSGYFFAAFVIQDGKVKECAPILRRNITHWKTKAILIRATPKKQLDLFS